MKFYELDLQQIIPYGIPLNTSDHVEYRSYINDFFLQGFENYFNQLFTVGVDGLEIDYSRSCANNASLYACNFCNDNQLKDFILEAGFAYYPTNDHSINAEFLYRLNSEPFGSISYTTAIAQYVSNSDAVFAELMYEGYNPYCYGIRLYGDVAGAVDTSTICQRLLENLKLLGTAHTKLDEIWFEDTSSDVDAYVGCYADDVSISCEVTMYVPVVHTITIGVDSTVPTGTTKIQSPYWWMYEFTGGSTLSNLWNPAYYAEMVTGTTSDEIVPGAEFTEAYFVGEKSNTTPVVVWDFDFSQTGNSIKIMMYNSKPEFYTDDSQAVNGYHSGLLVLPAPGNGWINNSTFDIPSDLYTISGTTITWNTSHVLYNLFYGKQGTAV